MIDDFTNRFMETHNYIVRASLTGVNELRVEYADMATEVYTWGDSYLLLEDELIPMDNYMVRVFIFYSICKKCRELKLPYSIMKYEGASSFFELIPLALDKEELIKELFLNNSVNEFLTSKKNLKKFDKHARATNLYHHLNILKGLIL